MDCRFKKYSRKKFAKLCGVPERTFLDNVRRLEKLLNNIALSDNNEERKEKEIELKWSRIFFSS